MIGIDLDFFGALGVNILFIERNNNNKEVLMINIIILFRR